MTENRRRNKNIEDIRPAKIGVKSNKNIIEREKKEVKIIQNVENKEELQPPTEEASKIIFELNNAKQDLIDSMKIFNKLLNVKILSKNKSDKEIQEEQKIVNDLAKNAMKVDNLNPKEGIFSMCILAIRQSLSLRDAGNELAYKMLLLEKRMDILEKSIKNDNTIDGNMKQKIIEMLGGDTNDR